MLAYALENETSELITNEFLCSKIKLNKVFETYDKVVMIVFS